MTEEPKKWSADEAAAIRAQLARMLQHPLFSQSERLQRFLRHIVEETLTGGGRRLNQFVIGIDVFDRGQSFDPAIDSIVRVEAGRLRSKLREYYDEAGRGDTIRIDLPKGGYAVEFRTAGTTPSAAETGDVERPRRDDKPVIAVLPFENLSGDPEEEYFTDGIAEDLITELSRVSELGVIARQSSFSYKGKSATAGQIAQELDAGYVVQGSVRKAGSRVRISAQLIDGSTEQHLWAERYDRELEDVFAVQDEVVRKIIVALKVTLPGGARETGRRGTDNMEAYDCLLRGVEHSRSFRRDDLFGARALYRRALSLDREYSEAHVRLAWVLVYEWIAGFQQDRAALDEALALTQRAVELDPDSAMAYSVLGWTCLWMDDYDNAISAGEKALQLDQSDAFACYWMAMCRAWADQTDAAMSLIERAMRLNPVEPYYFPRGLVYYMKDRLPEAIELFEKDLRNNPGFLPSRLYLAVSQVRLGREDDARRQTAEILRINPEYRTRAAGGNRIIRDPEKDRLFGDSLRRAGLP
jgi:TolB-like protein